jgi:hypothetical protein
MLKAIETLYKGYRFRSRLEARWAVFFDALGMQWVYEPEGVRLPDGVKYLPDFWIPILCEDHPHYPNAGYWLEIKPMLLTADQHTKCKSLAVCSGHSVCILAGQPWPGEFLQQKWMPNGTFYDFTDYDFVNFYLSSYIAYPCAASGCGHEWKYAYNAARSARFEHGETPGAMFESRCNCFAEPLDKLSPVCYP